MLFQGSFWTEPKMPTLSLLCDSYLSYRNSHGFLESQHILGVQIHPRATTCLVTGIVSLDLPGRGGPFALPSPQQTSSLGSLTLPVRGPRRDLVRTHRRAAHFGAPNRHCRAWHSASVESVFVKWLSESFGLGRAGGSGCAGWAGPWHKRQGGVSY